MVRLPRIYFRGAGEEGLVLALQLLACFDFCYLSRNLQ